MYFVFDSAITVWNDKTVQAKIIGSCPPPEELEKWWTNKPFTQIPDFAFSIDLDAPLLDNYFTGIGVDLYSSRLIEILRQAKVLFESFPAMITNLYTNASASVSYQTFHLLEIQGGVHMEKSEIDKESGGIRHLVLTQDCLNRSTPLFRLEEYPNLVLLHTSLKDILDKQGITGCLYIPTDDFQNVELQW